jgi:hypothetical protein
MSRIRLLAALLLAGLLLAAPAAHGASSNVVISQVFAGGGNTGAAFANDYVELFNRGSAAVDVSAWTIQYASASGVTWQPTALSGSIQPGHYYLVQLASAAAVGAALPTADATGATNLAASGGKVALVRDAAALTCGAAAGSCSAAPLVEDLIGYGAATDYEGGGPAPALSNTTAAVRAGGGCVDTDVSSADFAADTPAPRNSSSSAGSCGATPPEASLTQDAAVDIDIQPVLSVALERPSLSFGSAVVGDTPAAISERVTVVSNSEAGYTLTVRRSAFAPTDLPLGIGASAPSGAQLGTSLGGGALAPIPVAPASDLVVGTSSAQSASGGDVWQTSLGFTAALPLVAPGRYTATVTYTVIGG